MSTSSDTEKVVQPALRRVRIEEVDGDLELSYRRRLWETAGFLLIWWVGWTAGTILILCMVFTEPSVEHVLFAAPFVAAWAFVFVLLSWMLFGTEHLRLGWDGLEYRARVLVTLSTRTIPREELKCVSAGLTTYEVGREGEPSRREPCLKFETIGQPLQFAPGISEEEQRWLVQRLNEFLDALGRDGSSSAPSCVVKTSRGEVLRAAPVPIDPPSDSRIEVQYHADSLALVWQGEWSLPAIAGVTFIHLFWNGGIGLFYYQLTKDFQWFLFFFLIPFAAMGLFLVVLWLATLTAPLWRLTWTFGEREITKRLSFSDANAVVFNLGWRKRAALQPPIRIELRRREEEKRSGSLWALFSHPDGEYSLCFLDQADKELLVLKDLTEGDARWIADVLLHAFPSWSRDERPIVTL
ncbi:MAG TPA: hypothetical protein VMG10_11545 [Gemmataceae bacterium]|nr:hypothetical protein [Gemmataceae bacterium]